MRFKAEVRVTLKRGVLDPQGATVRSALSALGYEGFEEVRVGKLVELWLDAPSEEAARERVREVAARLLANPVLETFSVQVVPDPADAGAPAGGVPARRGEVGGP